MQDRFKFRVWNKVRQHFMTEKEMFICGNGELVLIDEALNRTWIKNNLNYKVSFCTGLKDKNGLNLLFECDIINMEGIKIGNCYENGYLLKDTTNFVIKGMGTKEWRNSEQEAIKRGCYYAERNGI